MCFMFYTWRLAARHLSRQPMWKRDGAGATGGSVCSVPAPCSVNVAISCRITHRNVHNPATSFSEGAAPVAHTRVASCVLNVCLCGVCVFACDRLCVDDECAPKLSLRVVKSRIDSLPSECFPARQGDTKQREYLGDVPPGRSPHHLVVPSLKQTAVSLLLGSLHLMSSFFSSGSRCKKKKKKN